MNQPDPDDPQLDEDTVLGHIRRAGGFDQLAAKWGTTPERLAALIRSISEEQGLA